MTTLEKIKATGGFLDCGAVGSMPLGYYMNGEPARSRREYDEVMELISSGKLRRTKEKMTTKGFPAYLTNYVMKGDIIKLA
jgi:hypothetical protein